MTNKKRQVILQILGEGGELTLIGDNTSKGWMYTLAIVDQTLTFIEEGGEMSGICGTASTWRGALKLMDIYPWHMLSAVHVHPEFAGRILRAACARLAKKNSSHAESRLRRWQEKCRRPEAE
ncbi:MAG: hypothetical protein CVV27_04415 [Candidatus Melainabacteria bacterium HGW-Melainabacteria-1]|nr:MAG: hypothetical protein CVV27_04415 [Candidatus Melainabacteria bacterium HGW-Melainabacteria-1]